MIRRRPSLSRKGFSSLAFCFPMTLMPASVSAYEVATHAQMTFKAFEQSLLWMDGRAGINKIGLPYSGYALSLGRQYFDILGTRIEVRIPDNPAFPPVDYEQKKLRDALDPLFTDEFRANAIGTWLSRGAIREDDNIIQAREIPQDDPYLENNLTLDNRPLHHFFDPQNDRSLDILGAGITPFLVQKSPNWAIGTTGFPDNQNVPNANRRNHFTVFDAREAMFRALTLKAKGPTGVANIPEGVSSSDSAREELRKTYWATTFKALGHVVHHIQDMAQPQHTRNDPHAGKTYAEGDGGALGHASFFENYIDARAKAETFDTDRPGLKKVRVPVLNYPASLPAFSFNRYGDFWSTAKRAGIASGLGVADYSSRSFYSAGTNIGMTRGQSFPSPTQNVGQLRSVDVSGLTDLLGEPIDGALRFVVGSVADSAGGSTAVEVKLSSEGLFDQFLTAVDKPAAYNLNHYNYNAQADLLVPRAVSYSAGLLNYFFRGKMQIELPAERVYAALDHSVETVAGTQGFRKLVLNVRNATPAVVESGTGLSFPQEMSGGRLFAIVKHRQNRCYSQDLSKEFDPPPPADPFQPLPCRGEFERVSVSAKVRDASGNDITALDNVNIPSGSSQRFSFEFDPPIPVDSTDIDLQVVYRGRLGEETDAVAVETKQIPGVTFFALHNASDYVMCVNGVVGYKDVDGGITGDGLALVNGAAYQAAQFATAVATNVQLLAEGSATPIATMPQAPQETTPQALQGRKFVRIAFLTDTGQKFSYVAGNGFPNGTPLGVNQPKNRTTYEDNGSSTYQHDTVGRFRQSYAHNQRFLYRSEGAPCTGTLGGRLPTNEPTDPRYAATIVPIDIATSLKAYP